jgi:hypothetical protein
MGLNLMAGQSPSTLLARVKSALRRRRWQALDLARIQRAVAAAVAIAVTN